MLSKNCGYSCLMVGYSCAQNQFKPTRLLWFLPTFVCFKDFLTQFVALLNTAVSWLFTSTKYFLYTLTTPPTINTMLLI